MRDYMHHDENDNATPISQLSDDWIQQTLRDGIEVMPGADCTAEDVRDRLLIEVLIREKGMRNGL